MRQRLLPVVFVVALGVRLTTVLRGGGLFGIVGYDGSVYYTAAAALAHGLRPYQDFLLLHPPGVMLALLPFAGLGRLIGDPYAFALARLGWMMLGALNAVLVGRILRPYGPWAAIGAALLYAVFTPALYSEHSTSLEALGSACLLGAVLILTRTTPAGSARSYPYVVAGLLLGVSSGTKIWGVAIALTVAAWTVRAAGPRRGLMMFGGALAGATAVCLPFFVAAPSPMWRMVVTDQVGRRRIVGGLSTRLLDISGASPLHAHYGRPLLGAVLVVAAAVSVLAVRNSMGRLALLLTVVTTSVLLAAPSWSVHYASLAAPSAVLVAGSAAAQVDRLLVRQTSRLVAAVLSAVALVAYGTLAVATLTFGSSFPGRTLAAAAASSPGCLTSDDPTVLIETNLLRRNLSRRCPLVADLGGYSYDLRPATTLHVGRAHNKQWQQFARAYLSSGKTTVIVRFRIARGYNKATKRLIASWPVLAEAGRFQLQEPTPAGRLPIAR